MDPTLPPFLKAAAEGDLNEVEQLLQDASNCGVLIFGVDERQKSALHLAAENGHEAVVRALLAAGASVHAADAEGVTPFMTVATRGHAGVAKLLLDAGVSPDEASGNLTALYVAADCGHAELVKTLLQAGASTDLCAHGRDSILAKAACNAALHGGLATIDAFLDHFRRVPAAVSVEAMVVAAVAASEVTDSGVPEDQKAVVRKLLLAAGKKDGAATNEALQNHFPEGRDAGALIGAVFMEAMLEANARVADMKAQRTAVQHLFLSVMAPHATGKKQESAEQAGVEAVGAAAATAANAPAGAV